MSTKVHEDQRRWLAEQLRQKGWGAKSRLAAHLGVRNDAITRILTEKDDRGYRRIAFDELMKMAEFFKSMPPGLEDLVHSETESTHAESEDSFQREQDVSIVRRTTIADNGVRPEVPLVGQRDLPVFGCSLRGRGVAMLSSVPVEYAGRPEPLAKVPDGYGIIVPDDTMDPEHGIGSIALVHPHLPPQAGDTCIFRRINADGETEVLIRKITRVTPAAWHIQQRSPKLDAILKRSEWDAPHVTVGNYKRR